MGWLLFLALIVVPIAEIGVFIQVGGVIGLWPTIAIVILTAIIGSALLRKQGFETLARARGSLDRGELPVKELFDGACILFAGALLLTPGFITDATGFLLMIPPVRAVLRRKLGGVIARHAQMRVYRGGYGDGGPFGGPGGPAGPRDPGAVDVEYEVIDETGPGSHKGEEPQREPHDNTPWRPRS